MITKQFYRWTALGTVLLLFVTVFSVAPLGIISAQENPGQGDLDQQDGLTNFQRTHAQLVQDSRASSATRQNAEYTSRYSIVDMWEQACANGTDTEAGVPEGWCNVLATAQNAPATTGPSSGYMLDNPGPNMMTTANAWESYDLNYYTSTYGGAYTPPDTMGAVGPTQFVVTQNGAYRFHDKLTGAPDVSLDVSATGFWPLSVDPSDNAGGDPRVRFDRLTDQWVIIAFTDSTVNRIVVARSDGPIISGATIWSYWYFIPGNTINGAADANCFVDYPMLGVDNNAILVGANLFTGTVSCSDSSIYIMPKSTLPGGGGDASATTYAFTQLHTPCLTTKCVGSPMPADNYESLANSYVMGQYLGSSALATRLQMGTISYVAGLPTTLTWQNITIGNHNNGPAAGVPYPGVPSPSGVGPNWGLDSLALRPIGGAHVRNGTMLLTLSNTVNGPTGTTVAYPSSGDRHSALVVEVNVSTGAVVQDFNIYDTTTGLGSQPVQYWMPAAIYNGQGHMVVGFSATDANNTAFAPSAAYATQLNSDPPNSFNTPVVYIAGTDTGNIRQSFETTARKTRWGDYSMTTVDPCNDMTVYTIQEYQDSGVDNWATGVARIIAPAPTVSGGSPDPVPLGSASEVVSVSGTGLYDTPSNTSAFCRTRLEASTTYPGLSINSVSYINETSMNIDFDTTGAACGNATVTNPDGQADDFIIDIGTVAQCTRNITIDDPIVTESSGGSFTVSISPTSAALTDVTFTVTDGSATGSGTDYTVTSSSPVTIPANASSVTIDFTTTGDTIFEGDEDFVVDLTGAINGLDTVTITDSQGTATITEDDNQPDISISPATVTHTEGNVGTTDYVFDVTLSNASTQVVTVDYTTNDGTATTADSDYADNDNTLTFLPGGSLTQNVTVQVNGDTVTEPNEDFTVTLNSSTNSTIDGANDTSTGEITNDDPQPEISISPATVTQAEGNAGTTDYVFTVTLSNASASTVTVDYTTNDGTATTADSDYVDNDNTLTFLPGGSLTQNITVQANGDTVTESNEDFTVTLNSSTNSTIDGANDTSTGNITNDDGQPVISISPATITQNEGDAGTTDYVFTVTLSNASVSTVTVDYTTNDGTATTADSDYVDNDNTLTFLPGGSLTQNVTVLVNGDTSVEPNEDFTVTLNSSTNSTIDPVNDTSTGNITNDDAAPVTISISPATVTHDEGNSGTIAYDFTVTLSGASASTITVDYTTNDGTATTADSDYVDNDDTLTFLSGDALTQNITVLVNGDLIFEPNEDFTVTLDSATNATIDGANDTSTGNITNDDVRPDNDLFVNATDLGVLPANTSQTVLNATISGTDPSLWCAANYTDSVWFSFTATADQLVTVDSDTSNFDTVLSAFTGTEGDLAVIACDDNGGAGSTSSMSFSTKSGITYYIMAAQVGTVPVAPGTDSLTINVSGVSRNDAVVLFDPATSNTGLLDSMLNSPNEFAYINTPPNSPDDNHWIMGDWNGDGVKTPAYYRQGVFRYTNDLGPTSNWSQGWWFGFASTQVGIVSGRFDPAFNNDCFGLIDANVNGGTGDLRFSLKYWCDMTVRPQDPGGGPLLKQWHGSPLPDSGNFTGTHQWVYGDWDNDGLDEPAVRRGGFITRSENAPSEGAATYGTGAQRWDTADGDGPGGHGLDDGLFVAGDWNGDSVDTWGVVYDDNTFYYRDVFGWNPGPFAFSSQTFTSSIATPRQVDSHWAATGGTSTPGPAGATIARASDNANAVGVGGTVDTSQNVEAELSVSKAGNYTLGEVGLVGDSIVWTITVANTGTAPANGVQITDNVPTELRVDDVLSDNGTVTVRGQTVTFTAESIGVGETAQFQVVTTILNQPSSGTFANSVNVVLPDGNGSGSDANLVASGTINSVDGLPATGYAPRFRW